MVQRQTENEEEEEPIQATPIADMITPLVQRQVDEEEQESIQTKSLNPQITHLMKRQGEGEKEDPAKSIYPVQFRLQKQEENEEEQILQTQKVTGETPAQFPAIEAQIHSLRSGGQTLSHSTRAFFEPRFGIDFSQVRVHNDPLASVTSRTLNSKAYTIGRDIVFGAEQYAPETTDGKKLIAHELTHVVQQSVESGNYINRNNVKSASPIIVSKNPENTIMRKGFESTIQICHRVLKSRNFQVTNGGVRVVLILKDLDKNIPNCRNFNFGVTLTQSNDWGLDNEIGTCEASTGGTRSFSFANLSPGSYYLTIWRSFDHPYCCLEGDILVFDEAVSNDSTGCTRNKDLSVMDIVHGALDLAGFIPVLGAIPDGVNAAIYVVEGDWANAGLSAVAMVPAWGDGVKLGVMGGKSVIKISDKAVIRLGEEGIANGLKEVKAASKLTHTAEEAAKIEKGATKLEKEAAEKLEKEAAEKALKDKIAKCEAIWAAYKALECPSCKGTDTAAERATKIACLTALLAGRREYLKEKCDYVLAGSIARGSAIAERGHEKQADQIAKMLAKCFTLPTK